MSELIKLSRDCVSYLIPAGDVINLKKNEQVRITQALGGSYTLLYHGNLVRIEGKDADAIGKEIVKKTTIIDVPITDDSIEKMAWDAMKQCFDPEIPVNIVDLGLIYDLSKKGNIKEGFSINIKMTLTAPGCGMGPSIAQDVDNKVSALPGVNDVIVEIVWDPIWDRSMMSEDAKLKLGMF